MTVAQELCGVIHGLGLGAELPTIWYEKISHGNLYWRLPFALALIFCPMHPWLLEGKEKEGEENRDIMEEELDLSPSPLSLYHSFEHFRN